MIVMMLSSVIGCAGTGETSIVNLRALPTTGTPLVGTALEGSAAHNHPRLSIIVMPFEDLRPDTSALGWRTHLGGGATRFDVPDGNAGEAVSRLLVEHLRQSGWEASLQISPQQKAEVMLTGEVLELTANAKSRVGSTKMSARSNLAFRIHNAAETTRTRVAVNAARSETVMVFEPERLERLLNEVLHDTFEKFMSETKLENQTLQLR